MGAAASFELRPEEVQELQDLTGYEPKEIKTLFKRFRRLDRLGRGTISADDIVMIPEVAMNPLAPRLTALFPRDSEDRITFTSFVSGLAIFSEKARPATRVRGVFYEGERDSHNNPQSRFVRDMGMHAVFSLSLPDSLFYHF
jgi:serine/threonine-protein phosphatase 2B regulatory subunit